jgi:hypothetical protein
MDPADAGPESRERAGASHSMSGDPASARADDSETTASCASEDYDMYPNIDDLLPDPASMRASGAQDATDFFRDVWGDTPISWRVPPNTLRSLREGFRNGDVAELVSRDCRDESNDVYDDDDVAEMLDRTKPPLRHTLSLPFCYAPGAHALRNSVLRMAYNAPTLAEDACDYDAKEVRDFVADDADEKKKRGRPPRARQVVLREDAPSVRERRGRRRVREPGGRRGGVLALRRQPQRDRAAVRYENVARLARPTRRRQKREPKPRSSRRDAQRTRSR